MDDSKISYEVIDKKQEEPLKKNYKNQNNYVKYCQAGKNKYQKELEKEDLFQRIRDLLEEKVNRIYDALLSIVNE